MRLLGIDPGTANCGFAALEVSDGDFTIAIVDVGVYRSETRDTIAERVRELAFDLGSLIVRHKPACIVVETPGFGIRDASAVAMLWAGYGALLGAANGQALVIDRTPEVWRRALGLPSLKDIASGHGLTAGARRTLLKRHTREAMQRRFPGVSGLLATCPANGREHAFDALAIACAWVASAAPTHDSIAAAARV